MLLTPGQAIFGVDARLLQLAARACSATFSLEQLSEQLGAPTNEVAKVTDQAVAAGWLLVGEKPFGHRGTSTWFSPQEMWGRLRLARTGKPLPRAQAELLVAKVLDAIHAHNRAVPEDAALVTSLAAYGSFVDASRTELGDVDLSLNAQWRADQQGFPYFPGDPHPDRFATTRRAIGGRSPFLSFSPLYAVEKLQTRAVDLYRVEDDIALWRDSDDTVRLYPAVFLRCVEVWSAPLSDAAPSGLTVAECERKIALARRHLPAKHAGLPSVEAVLARAQAAMEPSLQA